MAENLSGELKKLGLKSKADAGLEKEYAQYLDEIERISKIPIQDEKYLWDKTAQLYAGKMERIKLYLSQEGVNEQFSNRVAKDLNLFLSRCRDSDFHIALVGAVKAGKSTLINALLGMDIASTNVTPETASLTKFRHCSEGNYLRVTFYKEAEWEKLWNSAVESKAEIFMEEYENLGADALKADWLGKDEVMLTGLSIEVLKVELKKWTSSKYATHYFVKEVEVGLDKFIMEDSIVLVDTPGLDDVVEYRSNITREYINRANAVLVCVRSDALTGGELSTILSVFANTRYCPEKVFTIATQLDTLNSPMEDWKKQRDEWIKYLKGKGAYGSQELADNNLIATSAYLYMLLKNIECLNENEKFKLMGVMMSKFYYRGELEKDTEVYKKTRAFTGIIQLRNKIKDEIVKNYKSMQVSDIVENYNVCKAELKTIVEEVKNQQIELLKLSEENVEEVRKRRIEYEKQLENEKKKKVKLDELIEEFRKATVERAKCLSETIKGLV